jgi:hypothetical protein
MKDLELENFCALAKILFKSGITETELTRELIMAIGEVEDEIDEKLQYQYFPQ